MTKSTQAGRRWLARRSLIEVLPSITDRDRHLLTLLDELEVLTTAQITAILFGSPTTAAHRLLLLHRRDLLDRFRRHQPTGQPWHWTLGPLGARLTALAADRTPPTPSTLAAHRDRLAASPHLHHLLGVNQFYTLLAAHTRTQPAARLARWWPERHTTDAFAHRIRPDAHGVWTDHTTIPATTVGFFLEHDTGTEPIHRLSAKLAAYTRLAAAGGPCWPVLFWLPSTTRETHLHHHLAKLHVPIPVATAVADAHPVGPIWLLSGTAAPRLRLADLPCPASDPGPFNPGLPEPTTGTAPMGAATRCCTACMAWRTASATAWWP